MSTKVLVCDDQAALRKMISVLLRREGGFEVTECHGVADAKGNIEHTRFDAVITDLMMPDGTGLDVLAAARSKDDSTQVIVITAHATTQRAVEAMRLGAYDYLEKPFKNHVLLATLDKALEKRAIVEEVRALRAQVAGVGLIGKSPSMLKVKDIIGKVAPSPTSILITGESGTGKEMVAREIHRSSEREGRFIVINCGALPEQLMESELFGHVKGSFTGASKDKEGLFRAADGGTLFLDEVAELPLSLQVKLLRVLQEKSVRAVGAEEETKVDVRVLAATNRDVEKDIEEGVFRKDLYYRLNVIRLPLPPLRERPDDVRLLAEHFLEKHRALQKRATMRFADEALAWIAKQQFPGNVRELENVVERAVTLCAGDVISRDELPEGGDDEAPSIHAPLPAEGFDLDAYLAGVEKQVIDRALAQCAGVRKHAAKLLGMTNRSLRYRLQKFGYAEEEEG